VGHKTMAMRTWHQKPKDHNLYAQTNVTSSSTVQLNKLLGLFLNQEATTGFLHTKQQHLQDTSTLCPLIHLYT